MSNIRRVVFATLTVSAAAVWGQQVASEPHVGYLYPAGGQQGAVIQITAGGQFLRGAAEVYVSGEGVHGSVIKYMPQLRNINAEQRKLLQARLKELREKRLAELSERPKAQDEGQTTNDSSAFGVPRRSTRHAARSTSTECRIRNRKS